MAIDFIDEAFSKISEMDDLDIEEAFAKLEGIMDERVPLKMRVLVMKEMKDIVQDLLMNVSAMRELIETSFDDDEEDDGRWKSEFKTSPNSKPPEKKAEPIAKEDSDFFSCNKKVDKDPFGE